MKSKELLLLLFFSFLRTNPNRNFIASDIQSKYCAYGAYRLI